VAAPLTLGMGDAGRGACGQDMEERLQTLSAQQAQFVAQYQELTKLPPAPAREGGVAAGSAGAGAVKRPEMSAAHARRTQLEDALNDGGRRRAY
jgi:hypothetical protein